MYVHIYTHIYIYIYTHKYIYIYICIYIYVLILDKILVRVLNRKGPKRALYRPWDDVPAPGLAPVGPQPTANDRIWIQRPQTDEAWPQNGRQRHCPVSLATILGCPEAPKPSFLHHKTIISAKARKTSPEALRRPKKVNLGLPGALLPCPLGSLRRPCALLGRCLEPSGRLQGFL